MPDRKIRIDTAEETTPEEVNTQLREHEDDILGGLLKAADFKESEDEIVPIAINRGGKEVLRFHIRPLSDAEYNNAREKHATFGRNKTLGTRIIEKIDNIRYRAEIIYIATIAEDKKKIWENKAAWNKLNVLSATDLIEAVLKAGEIAAILEKIDQISGYGANLEETAKN